MKFLIKLKTIFLAFLKLKLSNDHSEPYNLNFSPSEFKFFCPRAASDFDDITRSVYGVRPDPEIMGAFGTWLTRAGRIN